MRIDYFHLNIEPGRFGRDNTREITIECRAGGEIISHRFVYDIEHLEIIKDDDIDSMFDKYFDRAKRELKAMAVEIKAKLPTEPPLVQIAKHMSQVYKP